MDHKLFLLLSPKKEPSLRIFMFPYAGSGPFTFAHWPKYIDNQIELLCLNLPARGTRLAEAPYTQMHQIIENSRDEIDALLDKPFIFIGYSLGAKIAYELMSDLYKRNQPLPVHWIAIASQPPHMPRRSAPIHQLDDKDFICALKKYAGTPEEILSNHEWMELLLPSLKGDFSILENTQPAPKTTWPIPISILGGQYDQQIDSSDLTKWSELFPNVNLYKLFPGNHFFIREFENELLSVINDIAQLETLTQS
jgi:surfactin synthase thioesterase subunit